MIIYFPIFWFLVINYCNALSTTVTLTGDNSSSVEIIDPSIISLGLGDSVSIIVCF